jgi:hypothetical protein
VNDIDHDAAYADALGSALTLPTWRLRRRERSAARRVARGAPPRAEMAHLLAIRTVLRQRDQA